MIRHTDNQIHVLYNRCAHRGTELVTDISGNTGKTLRCPYHAWTYRTDGTLLGVPVKEGYQDTGFNTSCASKGMTPVSNVFVYREFVFAMLEESGIGFEEFFGDSLSSIDNMIDRSPEGRLEVVGNPLRYMHHCNWKMLVENQTDSFHPMIVHESSAGVLKEVWEGMQPYNGPTPMAVECILPFTSSYSFMAKMGIRIWQNGHGHTGVNFSIHSDAPVTPLSPLFSAWCAVNRQTASGRTLGEHEKISVEEALHAITIGAAYTIKLDHLVGSIESGKFADFAVLEDNPYEIAPEQLNKVRVWGTVVGGITFPAV